MAAQLDRLFLAGFAGLLIAAAIADLRRLVIPNPIVLAICLLWPLHVGITRAPPPTAALSSIAGAAVVLIGGSVLFARGLIGGGDVKLLAAVSLWCGAAALPALLMLTALLGGVLALLALTPLGRLPGPGLRARSNGERASTLPAWRAPVPYGVAIAAAALIVTLPPHFG